MSRFPIEKTEGRELPVPEACRPDLKRLADALVFQSELAGVCQQMVLDPIDTADLDFNRKSIAAYPDTIGALNARAWLSSVYVWQGGHWDLLVDLSTAEGETSDLVFHLKVRERSAVYYVAPGLVYVP